MVEKYFVESDGELVGTYASLAQAKEALTRMRLYGMSGLIINNNGQVIR